MKPIQEKVLKSGLIDKATAEMMEKFGILDHGSANLVNDDALKNATQATLSKLAEDLAVEVEREHKIRETALDLDRLRWPVQVCIVTPEQRKQYTSPHALVITGQGPCTDVGAVMDQMGRYYFRSQESKKEWFVPGYYLQRIVNGDVVWEVIVEAQELFIGERPVCWQVSTMKEQS